MSDIKPLDDLFGRLLNQWMDTEDAIRQVENSSLSEISANLRVLTEQRRLTSAMMLEFHRKIGEAANDA